MLSSKGGQTARPSESRRSRLLGLLRQQAVVHGATQLASGAKSDIYFDLRISTLDPESSDLIASEFLEILNSEGIELVGGLEVGAVPIISSVVTKSVHECPVKGFFVRKAVKEHGTRKRIEGNFDPTKKIALLDDVTTSGGSVLQAAQVVREQGGQVAMVLTIVDREEGARGNLHNEGIELRALFTKSDFRS
ncbi:MAG: orotate phosphoribosyltransferase [Hyphomicrobiales bacterium]|nr:orotate phosphoribosyltransferase [Hyphomicrobiales bacterium]